jgi:hypothetical protein
MYVSSYNYYAYRCYAYDWLLDEGVAVQQLLAAVRH